MVFNKWGVNKILRKKVRFENVIIAILTSFVLIVRRFFLLILKPYPTLRKISLEDDYWQVIIIFFFVFLYFKFIYYLRPNPYPATLIFFMFLGNFFFTVLFFYFLSLLFNKKIKLFSFIFTFSYALFPTLTWFVINSFFYLVLPPPRTYSFFGKAFSIFFTAFSLSILFWKIILFYLALRFSTKLNFYRIIYFLILYLCIFAPYSIFLYHLKLFRVPFI